jgi:ubiquitin carboxyl-terminal hydrolase 8
MPGNASVAEEKPQGKSDLQVAWEYWNSYTTFTNSILEKYWVGVELQEVECQHCRTLSYTWSTFTILKVHITGTERTLKDCLKNFSRPELIPGFWCKKCNCKRDAKKRLFLARLPRLLCIQIIRFTHTGLSLTKTSQRLTWNFNDLDLADHTIPPEERKLNQEVDDRGLLGPFNYECYAVVSHVGKTLHSGHYVAYVQDPKSNNVFDWYRCSDSHVVRCQIGSNAQGDVKDKVFLDTDYAVPYLLFWKRKDYA